MPSRFRRLFVFSLSLSLSLSLGLDGAWAATEAGALPDPSDVSEPVRLEYHAASGCPDEDLFRAFIRARTSHVRVAREGESARTFVVRLENGPHASGTVVVTDSLGTAGVRSVSADSCNEAADAVALIVALAVDPRALLSRPPSNLPVSSSDAGAAAVPSGAGDLGSANAGAGLWVSLDASSPLDASAPDLPDAAVPLQLSPSRDVPPVTAPPAETPRPTRLPQTPADPNPPLGRHFFAGGDFVVASAVTPNVLLGGAPYIGWRSTPDSLLAPTFRASFVRIGTPTLTLPGVTVGQANFTWTVGRLEGCATLFPRGAVRVAGCALVESGVLSGQGDSIVAAKSDNTFWLAAGPLARVEWTFLGPLMLNASLAPMFRITANRFYFFDGTTAYKVPVVGATGEIGAGIHFQ